MVALSNPKRLLFFTAFLPQFINQGQPQLLQCLILASITILIDTLIMMIYASGGKPAARYLTVRGLTQSNRGCAVIMFTLALLLAVYKKN